MFQGRAPVEHIMVAEPQVGTAQHLLGNDQRLFSLTKPSCSSSSLRVLLGGVSFVGAGGCFQVIK